MLFEIKSKIDEQVIFSLETKSFKFCIESAVKLKINLRSADLSYADLSYADLRSADLDFSSGIPFWCGGLNVKVDAKIAIQMAYHFCKLDCKDKEFIGMKKLLKNFANKFHRVSECGEIK